MTADDANETSAAATRADDDASRYSGLAIHAAAWGFAFLILRLFSVSGYDWETAFAVSTTIGLGDGLPLLFGSLMSGHVLATVLLMCVLPLLMADYLWGSRARRPAILLLTTVGFVILVAVTVSFRLWWLPVATAAALGALALIHHMPSESHLRQASVKVIGRAGAVAGVAVLLTAAFTHTPWVPQEQIQTTDGTIAGYVLSVDSGYLNVLTEDQEFKILVSRDVISRD